MTLGTRLKQLRKDADLTLKDLAERTGYAIGYLSDIEQGRTLPSLTALKVIAGAFDMSVVMFLNGVDL